MISVNEFLRCVQENAARVTHYESAGDGNGDGGCDCIGLIIGALRVAGVKWPGTHGSNWAARNAMATFGYIDSEADCFPGMIVYKAREPYDDLWKLPGNYKNDPDQRDYYHVGVVTSIDPFVITHCTGVVGGIKRDNTLGKWRWGGKLKYVDYDDAGTAPDEEPLYLATVTADNGYPVKMRSGPGTDYGVIDKVPLGSVVEVYDVLDGWSQIGYDGQMGYMMNQFLREEEENGGTDANHALVSIVELKAAYANANMAAEILRRMIEGE